MTGNYEPHLIVETKSMISGEHTDSVPEDHGSLQIPVIQAFMNDPEIQEMRVVSGNIGFIKTYRKTYKPIEKPASRFPEYA